MGYEYHRRLTHIMGMTNAVSSVDGHIDQLWIAGETDFAGMSLVWRVNQRVALFTLSLVVSLSPV